MEQKLITKTQTHFDFVDRIKILFGKIVEVEVIVWIPTQVEAYNATSKVRMVSKTKSLFKKDKPGYGYVPSKTEIKK